MRRRTIIAIVITLTLCFGIGAYWSAETTGRDGDTDANIVKDGGAEAGSNMEKKKDGNRVVKALTAPFRAFRRLFGGGKDDGKLQRLSEKDVARFESTGTARISDATTPAEARPSASGDAREHLAQGKMLLSSGRINEAITELSLAASLDPRLSEAHSLLGVAYDRKGMHDRAQDAYDRAVKANPEDAQTLNNQGFSLYQNGNYRAAVDKLKKAARMAPTDQRILNNLALAQVRLGKYDDAYKNFARAGGELTGHLNTAVMLERLGRDDEAIKQYEAARRTQPNSTVALQRLADLYRRNGRLSEAQAAETALAAN
ncbi:MAG TPA: tetratricopeptide repeat protein [Pyrinomonadaceae bacterium]|nr:tetratricopeptide repeat protein [Pyrinomonadaceae bacterium]